MASARIFNLKFSGPQPKVIAYDGQPVEPHEQSDGQLLLGPGMRMDLVLDCMGNPGDWMFHCHILEHAAGGMMGTIRIA